MDVRKPGFPEGKGEIAHFNRTLKPGGEAIERDDIQVAGGVEQRPVERETFKPLVVRATQIFDPEIVGDHHQKKEHQRVVIEDRHQECRDRCDGNHQGDFDQAVFGDMVEGVECGQVAHQIK